MKGFVYNKLILLVLSVLLLCSCKGKVESRYEAPAMYSADALMTTYNTNIESIYKLRILFDNGKYKITVNNELLSFEYLYDGQNCTFKNPKFGENDFVISNASVMESLFYELNLEKFNEMTPDSKNEIHLVDGSFKHILTVEKNTYK